MYKFLLANLLSNPEQEEIVVSILGRTRDDFVFDFRISNGGRFVDHYSKDEVYNVFRNMLSDSASIIEAQFEGPGQFEEL
jgi:hypothetical protein